jgi:hypothetical protein
MADGVVVINDVFMTKECNTYMNSIIDDFANLGTGIDKNNIAETWTTYNLPPQTRPGLFQALMSNTETVWTVRSHPNVKKIFTSLYSNLCNEEVDDFIVSGDGINIKPGFIGPFMKENTKDWAHVDQTVPNDIYKCIQGQAVLTNTSASFVASPKSHLIFDKMLTKIEHDPKSNWVKFADEDIEKVKKMVLDIGGSWQIPIMAKRGSFIVWASSVIHSARLQCESIIPTAKDKYRGWRGVIYVCYRPKQEFSSAEIKRRKKVFDENRVTNHWGTKMFGKKPGNRFGYVTPRHDEIEKMINNPKIVYDKLGTPDLNDEQLELLGF